MRKNYIQEINWAVWDSDKSRGNLVNEDDLAVCVFNVYHSTIYLNLVVVSFQIKPPEEKKKKRKEIYSLKSSVESFVSKHYSLSDLTTLLFVNTHPYT